MKTLLKQLLFIVLAISFTNCSENIERLEVEPPSIYINKNYTSTKPLAYKLNLPRFDEVSTYRRRNSTTVFAKEVDRKLIRITDSVHSQTRTRLKTPIRIGYIPVGTKFTVIGEYIYFSDYGQYVNGLTNRHMLIMQDEYGNKSELSAVAFRLLFIISASSNVLSSEEEAIFENIKKFQNENELILDFCIANFIENPPNPMVFFNHLMLENEVTVKVNNIKCNRGYRIHFKTLESYLTAQYYFAEWHLCGYWNQI